MFFAKAKQFAVATAISFLAMSYASAYTLDILRGATNSSNSGTEAELSFAELVTQEDLILTGSTNNSGGLLATMIAGSPNQYVIDLTGFTPLPGYFLVKFGSGGFSGNNTFLFQNIEEMNKLVFKAADVNYLIGECGGNNCNISRLSHYTLFKGEGGNDSTGGEVPEPATAALFGLGLLGFAASRRKWNSKAA